MKVLLFLLFLLSSTAHAHSGAQAKLAGLAKGHMAGPAPTQGAGLSAQDLGIILSSNDVVAFLADRPIAKLTVRLAPEMPETTAFVISVSVDQEEDGKSETLGIGDRINRHCIINIVAYRNSKATTANFEVIISEICEMK
jgi:uncharacterized membrane-anchored protein